MYVNHILTQQKKYTIILCLHWVGTASLRSTLQPKKSPDSFLEIGPQAAPKEGPVQPALPAPKRRAQKAENTGAPAKPAKANYNKKMGGKISGLSTKMTEIRCLATNVGASTL